MFKQPFFVEFPFVLPYVEIWVKANVIPSNNIRVVTLISINSRCIDSPIREGKKGRVVARTNPFPSGIRHSPRGSVAARSATWSSYPGGRGSRLRKVGSLSPSAMKVDSPKPPIGIYCHDIGEAILRPRTADNTMGALFLSFFLSAIRYLSHFLFLSFHPPFTAQRENGGRASERGPNGGGEMTAARLREGGRSGS